jgi:hypothetical protein
MSLLNLEKMDSLIIRSVGDSKIGWNPLNTRGQLRNERTKEVRNWETISESLYPPQKLCSPLHVTFGTLLHGDEGTFTFRICHRI